MPTGVLPNRYRGLHFLIELDGVARGAFGYCAGLDTAQRHVNFYISDDEIDLLDVADPGHECCIILAQGVAFDDVLPAWQRTTTEGHAERHDGAIVEVDDFGRVLARWRFCGGWPATLERAMAAGAGGETRIETLEIAHDGLTRG